MGNILLFFRQSLLLAVLCLLSFLSGAQVTEQWVRRYNGPGNSSDIAHSLVVDAHGNVYVTGLSSNINGPSDYATIKYDSNGNELWIKRYNGPANGNDAAQSLAVDAQGNVYVTGYSADSGGYLDYATIKYDSNGNELWIKRYNGPANGDDVAQSLAVDAQGNVYVTGYSNGIDVIYGASSDYATIKYDAEGNVLWIKNGPGNRYNSDEVQSLALDASGNVYVTGSSFSSESDYDYTTIKYDADGNELWIKRYDGPLTGYDAARSLAVDAQGNVYVTGISFGGEETGNDYATIKYDADGNELWIKRYDGPLTGDDVAQSLAVDAQGNVYVTGYSVGIETGDDYATIKYDADGNELWIKRYNEPNSSDLAISLVVDAQGNVYVTGSSNSIAGFDSDYATIKYTQTASLPKVKAGADQTLYLGYGPGCVTLKAQASEGSAPYKYHWSPGGGTSSKVKICPAATTTYTVTVTDANGNTASDQVKVKVIDVRCGNKGDKVMVCHKGKPLCIASSAVNAHLKHGDQLGSCNGSLDLNSITENTDASQMMEEMGNQFRVLVAPNPVNTTIRLQYELPADGTVSFKVYDVVGREVVTVVQAERKAGVYSMELSNVNLAKGVYYYRALLTTKQKTSVQTGKIMVVR